MEHLHVIFQMALSLAEAQNAPTLKNQVIKGQVVHRTPLIQYVTGENDQKKTHRMIKVSIHDTTAPLTVLLYLEDLFPQLEDAIENKYVLKIKDGM